MRSATAPGGQSLHHGERGHLAELRRLAEEGNADAADVLHELTEE